MMNDCLLALRVVDGGELHGVAVAPAHNGTVEDAGNTVSHHHCLLVVTHTAPSLILRNERLGDAVEGHLRRVGV